MDLTIATQSVEQLFRLGSSQLAVGNLEAAVQSLEKSGQGFLKLGQYKQYIQSQIYLIVIYTEMENFNEIERIRGELVDVIWKQKKSNMNTAIFYYALGMCYFRKNQLQTAQNHLNQGLVQALQAQKIAEQSNHLVDLLNAKINVCFISYGFVNLFCQLDHQIPVAVQELKNMGQLLEQCKSLELEIKAKRWNVADISQQSNCTWFKTAKSIKEDLDKLELGYNITKANILRKEKKNDSAEQLYWMCYELSQRNYERQYISPYLFYFMGLNYMDREDYEQASIFLNLAKKSIRKECFKKLSKEIHQTLKQLKENIISYDMVVHFNNKLIVEKQKGNVNFKNQFILLDLLKLFVTHPGTVYSKESLMEKVWQQKYDPCTHDNKIYVTIKRLRELVEPNYEHPKYIFRRKEGYYLNKNVRILLK